MNTTKTHLKFNNFLKGVQLLKHKKKIHVYLIKIEPFIKTIINMLSYQNFNIIYNLSNNFVILSF